MNKLKILLLKKRKEKEKIIFHFLSFSNAQPSFSTSLASLPYVFQMHSNVDSLWLSVFRESPLISMTVGSPDFNMVHL